MKFEAGKTYRTVGGEIAGPIRNGSGSNDFPLCGQCGRYERTWTLDGKYLLNGHGPHDLISGAIEDENRTAEGIAYEARNPDAACIGRAAIPIHPVEKLWRECGLPEYFLGNGGSNTHLYALYDAIRAGAKDEPKSYAATKLANHSERLMNLQDRICALEDVAKLQTTTIDALTQRVVVRADRHAQKIGKIETRIDGQAGLLLEVVAELDWLRGKIETSEAIDTIKRETAAAPRRTFKGGWLNVYIDAAGPYFTRPWDSHEEADKQADPRERRIACIHIPKITEGAGL